jgi:hypothetical protein
MTGPLDDAIWRITGRNPERLRPRLRLPDSDRRARERTRRRRRTRWTLRPLTALSEPIPSRRIVRIERIILPERPMLGVGEDEG